MNQPLVALAAILAVAPPAPRKEPPPFSAPAGRRLAQVVPGGVTILPNGRQLTPVGRRLYTNEDLWNVVLSPDGASAVAFHEKGLTVRALKGDAAPITIALKEFSPAGVFTRDGSRLIVSAGDAGGILILDPSRPDAAPTAIAGSADGYINDLALSADGNLVYAVDIANQTVVVFDLAAKQQISSTPAGRQPYALTLSADGKQLFVANIGLFDYTLIPPPTDGVSSKRGITRPPFGFPSRESETGVTMEGRKVAGLGSPYVPDAQSLYAYTLADPRAPRRSKTAKAGLLIHGLSDSGKAVGGSAPNALLLRGNDLFVSNANNDTVQRFDAATLTLKATIKLAPQPALARLRGVIPAGMALSGDGSRLYVCEAGLNAIAVIDAKTNTVLGHLPTGWFPIQCRLTSDGQSLVVATQKGLGRGPRGPKTPRPETDERYGLPDMPGMLHVQALPADLAAGTRAVLQNNGLVVRSAPLPALPKEIEYVVYINKENHTFDGIFGGLKGANGEPDYAEFGREGWIREKGKTERLPVMPNHINLAEQFAISDNFYMEPQASGDGHRWLVGVYPSLWTTRVFYTGWDFRASPTAKGRYVSFGSNGSQIPEDYLENGSIWEHLHRGGIPFRNYGEGFEFPSVDEDDETDRSGAHEVVNFPMPKVLFDNTCFEFPIFNMSIPDIAKTQWFIEDLEKERKKRKGKIPKFLNIALSNDHGADPRPDRGYPYLSSWMADNDLALGRLVEYLTHLPEWKKMAIFVTQDDSGGDNDHVDRHRSYVLCISPYAKHGFVGHDHTSIMSIHKTLYRIMGLGPNNLFDATATDLAELFTTKPNFTPYKHVPVDPRVFRPEATIDPSDPRYDKRRKEKTVKMDDPEVVERLRARNGEQ
jgi:DNA-binding beta-propeller fold protein YncE